jgi:hypothetical protein
MLDIHSQNDPFKVLTLHRKHCLDFSLYFQLSYLHEETCFQQAGSSAVEGITQAILDSSDQWKVPASLSLFLKSEKIPDLLYLEKAPEYTGPSSIVDLLPQPTGLRQRSQIIEGRVLRPFSILNNLQLIVWTRSILQHICSFLQSAGGFQKLQPSGFSNLSLVCG